MGANDNSSLDLYTILLHASHDTFTMFIRQK